MQQLRVGFAGASGVGKTTLSNFLVEKLGLPLNPIGSRWLAKKMGFESPYDVDAAGKRAEFQRLLPRKKADWEKGQENFISDRTHLDNLVYFMLHGIDHLDTETYNIILEANKRYTHIIHINADRNTHLIKGETDPARRNDRLYQKLYAQLLAAMVCRHVKGTQTKLLEITHSDLELRKTQVEEFLELNE